MTNMNHRRNLVKTDTESIKFNRNLNWCIEIEVQPIMDAYRCTYKDVEEAIDLFNLDFKECNQA